MKNLILFLWNSFGLIWLSYPAFAALPEGHPAPNFQVIASKDGKAFTYSLTDALKRGPVVIYFYPSAYTGGCNVQAHTFAINHDKFIAAGASIVGVSQDSIQRLNDFSADPNYCAGKFPVASDIDGSISKSYDLAIRNAVPGKQDSRGAAIDHDLTERATFVVTPDGNIAATIADLKPDENVNRALEVVQKLTGKTKETH